MTAQSIPPHELASWINTQTAVDLIDVRSPAEFEESHLTAARNVPLAGLSASDLPNDDRPVVFVCRSGQRSGQACAKFVERRVFSVAGGTQACIDVGMSAVSGKRTMALDRQVRIAAGSLVLLGFALSFLNPWMLGISVFVGAGLVFSGVTDTCTMGMLLAKMPWNQVTRQSHPSNMVAMLICSGALSAGNTLSAVESLDVKVAVHADKEQGRLRPIWRFFGADEPNYAYMKDGRKLLTQMGELAPQQVYFRTHNLLTSGPGTPALKWGSTNAYTEDASGNPVYDWKLLDLIFDTYLQRGVKPYVQIGFMPKALSTHPDPYEPQWRPGLPYELIYTGWTYPPKDYDKWMELVFQWTKHCVDRYGKAEVESWYWETWNEANIGYWKGTRNEFLKTHDYAIAGVLKALPTARVGGPDTAGDGGDFAREFYRHCLSGKNAVTGETGTKLDFVSFHAKGAPNWVNDHVQMGIAAQLKTIDTGFKLIAGFEELKSKPIIIGESDPEGCAACQGNRFAYRNGTMYSSYTAATFARKHDLADRHGVNLEGALTWAFTFEDQPYFAGFRQLASNGIPMPVFNVFRMFSKMQGQRIEAVSDHQIGLDDILKSGVRGSVDVGVLASRSEQQIAILLWHYHDDDLNSVDAEIQLEIDGLPKSAQYQLERYLIDSHHSNSHGEWLRAGAPVAPDQKLYDRLQQASALALVEQRELPSSGDSLKVQCSLARQGVTLQIIRW